MIHKDKCLELGLPEPKSYETQAAYVTSCIAAGYILNTRICRYIAIFNLHSIVPVLKRKKVPFTLAYDRAICPFTGELRPEPVDHVYMTAEQREQYIQPKKLGLNNG
jgi:hypothetical protein